MKILEHLSLSESPLARSASKSLATLSGQTAPQLVNSVVALISGINAGIIKIPSTFPNPRRTILEKGFARIREAGGKIFIRVHSDEEYTELDGGSLEKFLDSCSPDSRKRFFASAQIEHLENLCVDLDEPRQ